MAIYGFFGSLGSGKTLLANYYLREKIKQGKKIISHAFLKIPYMHLSIDDIFEKAITETYIFKNKVLFMDEFHLLMESRRSTAGVNVDFSQSILIQLGKLDCDLFYTAQLLSQMDLRIKEMQKYFFFCSKQFRPSEVDDLTFEEISRINIDDRIPLHPVKLVPLKCDIYILVMERISQNDFSTGQAVFPWEEMEKIFNDYDTREIIKFDRKKYLRK